jgi:hypothetical protein
LLQVLFSEGGYTYLDVRPALECEEVGKVKGSVNIPMMHAKRVYDPEQRKKVLQKEENPDFVAQVTPLQGTEQHSDSCTMQTQCVFKTVAERTLRTRSSSAEVLASVL